MRRSTRRILKWTGLVGCVAPVCATVASRYFWLSVTTGSWDAFVSYGTVDVTTYPARDPGFDRRLDFGKQDSGFELGWIDMLQLPTADDSGGQMRTYFIPIWPLTVIFLIPTAIVWHADRRAPSHCQSCGYNLTGNTSGTCPECGTAIKGANE